MPKSRALRWGLVALVVSFGFGGTYALLQGRGAVSSRIVEAASFTGTVAARDVAHQPWYRMQLLHDEVSFQGPGATASTQPQVSASAGILVDLDTGAILWQQSAHARLPMASTIKVLTAMVALENFASDRLVTVTQDALFQAGDESKMFLKAGQVLTIQELLSGMLMVSANDAADVIAIDTVGMERFVGAMNAQAQALGLHDTHVTSPVGLDDPDMYSSAYDLAVMAAVDEQRFPSFGDLVRTPFLFLPATAGHPAFYLNNINLLLSMYPAAVGIKTGYTGNAGACEIGMAVRDGHRLLSVLLNGQLVYTESRRLLDWGFVQEGLPTTLPTPTPSPTPAGKPSPRN